MASRVKLPGQAPHGLELNRDPSGVLRVRAIDAQGLYWGMGFAHALDRSSQLILTRILGQGRASELLASTDEMLEVDIFFRRMNWSGGAETELERLEPSTRLLCQAYCDGINARLGQGLSWEWRLMGVSFEPWAPVDSLMLMRLIGWIGLAQSQSEMQRLFMEMVQGGIDEDRIHALFPGALKDVERSLLEQVNLGERLVPAHLPWTRGLPRAMASNNWVVSPERSATGSALLSNDPHLEVNRLPAVWQELVMETSEGWGIGATMPGIPALIAGRTRDLSWGVTYAFMDGVDAWIEDCQEGCYRREDQWVPFEARTETILRKGKPPEQITLYENEHGLLEGDPHVPGLYLTQRWAAGEGGADSLNAAAAMWSARSTAEGMALMGTLETAWNWVFADSKGDIGYQMSGLMPKRRGTGIAPLPGWDPANDWQGFVPVAELPRVLNPAGGLFATANQDLNHLGRQAPIRFPMGDHRARRIMAALDALPKVSIEDIRVLQMETYSLHAHEFLESILPLLPQGPARSQLEDWDRCYDPDSVTAGLFEDLYRETRASMLEPALGPEVRRYLDEETGIFIDFSCLFDAHILDAESPWWEGLDRPGLIASALERAASLPEQRWGDRNRVVMSHILFGDKLPRWMGFDHGPIELPGSRGSVHQGQVYRSGGRDTSFAPSWRFITDMGTAEVHTSLPGGASDRRFSKYYRSDLELWKTGRLKRLAPDDTTGS